MMTLAHKVLARLSSGRCYYRWLFATVFTLALNSPARADELRLGTGLDITWDRSAQPSGSNSIVIPVFNDSSNSTQQLFGWGIGLKIVPIGGTGTLSINPSSIAYPSGEVIADPDPSSAPQVKQTAGVTSISSSSLSDGAYTVPPMGGTLVQLAFTSTNASGAFELEAVNDAAGNFTNWTDQNGSDQPFSNSPFASGSTLNLGTINVLEPSAVPEPSALVLAGLGAAGVAAYRRRYRRRVQRDEQRPRAE